MRAKRIMMLFVVAALMVVALTAGGLAAYADPVTLSDEARSEDSRAMCIDYCFTDTGDNGGGGGDFTFDFCRATCDALEDTNPGGGYNYPYNVPPPAE